MEPGSSGRSRILTDLLKLMKESAPAVEDSQVPTEDLEAEARTLMGKG
jgi:hypothetical protein